MYLPVHPPPRLHLDSRVVAESHQNPESSYPAYHTSYFVPCTINILSRTLYFIPCPFPVIKKEEPTSWMPMCGLGIAGNRPLRIWIKPNRLFSLESDVVWSRMNKLELERASQSFVKCVRRFKTTAEHLRRVKLCCGAELLHAHR